MKIFHYKYLYICLALLFTNTIHAQPITIINHDFQNASIGNKIEILEDARGVLSFDDILSPEISRKFSNSDADEPNFGFTSSIYWIKFRLQNKDQVDFNTYLEISYPLLDSITLFLPGKDDGWVKKSSGDHLHFNTRDIYHRNFIFKLNPESEVRTYYIRFRTSSSMNLPVQLWSEKGLMNKIGIEQILFGIFFGSVIIMIIYNIFLFIGLRDISFIYLFLFIASWGLAQFTIDGLSFQYLWSGFTWWSDINLPLFIFSSLAAAVQFCRSLLNTKEAFPSWDVLLKYQKNIFITGIILSLFLNYALSIKLAAGMAIPAIISLFIIGLAGLKRRNRSAAIFIGAWGLFLAGAILFAVKSFGVFPSNYLTNSGIQIGFFAMMVLLSIAVQDRVESEKKEKENAQNQLIQTLKHSEKVLAEKVEERTQEINRINIILMDRAIELAGINRLTEKVNSSLRLPDVLLFACEEFVKIFEVKYSAIFLLGENRKFELASFYSKEDNHDINIVKEFLKDSEDTVTEIIEAKLPLFLPPIPGTKDKEGQGSVLIVPVILLQRVIGLIVLQPEDPEHKFSKDETDLAKTMAVQVAGAVQNAKQYSETENALGIAERDLEIGREIQSGFFPASIQQVPGWEIAAYFKGARQVAGDFYDIFQLDNSKLNAFIIADVCDKGVGAALFMVVFRSLLRAYSEKNITAANIKESLRKVLLDTNNYIANIHSSSNMFASVFFGIIDPNTADVYYINAGHDAPVLVSKEGLMLRRLIPTGPVVGMFPEMMFEVECIHLNKGDLLFAFTDGATDARNENNKLFSEEGLLKIIKAPWTSAYSLLFNTNSALKKHIGSSSQFDDITELGIRRKLSNEDNIFSIERSAYAENLEELRSFVEGAAVQQKMDKDSVLTFKLAAEEICSNIINYGFKENKGWIKISFEHCSDRAILNISDNGIHFSPDQAEVPDIHSGFEDRKIGGLGIHLIRQLMDEIIYTKDESGNNLLILKKKIKLKEIKHGN